MSVYEDALKYLSKGGSSYPHSSKKYAEGLYEDAEKVIEFIKMAGRISAEQTKFKSDIARIWPEKNGY